MMREYKGVVYLLFVIKGKWGYTILNKDKSILLSSTEWFESEGEASLAAIGHISLLQQGAKND
jgi:hypothetical protein